MNIYNKYYFWILNFTMSSKNDVKTIDANVVDKKQYVNMPDTLILAVLAKMKFLKEMMEDATQALVEDDAPDVIKKLINKQMEKDKILLTRIEQICDSPNKILTSDEFEFLKNFVNSV